MKRYVLVLFLAATAALAQTKGPIQVLNAGITPGAACATLGWWAAGSGPNKGKVYSCESSIWVLQNDVSGAVGTITGSGTAGKMPKFTAGTVIGDSGVLDDGSGISFTAGREIYLPDSNTRVFAFGDTSSFLRISIGNGAGIEGTLRTNWSAPARQIDLPDASGTVALTSDISDVAYDAGTWNGSVKAPSKNAVRDQIETMLSTLQPLDSDLADLADGLLTSTKVGTGSNCYSWGARSFNPNENATNYAAMQGTNSVPTSTETTFDTTLAPAALVFTSLCVMVDVAPAGSDSWTVTVRDDGADISGTSATIAITGATASACWTGTSGTVAALSKINLKIVGTATVAAAAEMLISWCTAP